MAPKWLGRRLEIAASGPHCREPLGLVVAAGCAVFRTKGATMNNPVVNTPPPRPAAGKSGEERPRSPDEAMATLANVEGEIREFVRRDVAPAPRRLPPVDGGDGAPGNINALVERISGGSIREIDALIAELTVVRDYLVVEGERVQREVANFAQVSQAATASAKVILESMGQWKGAVGAGRDEARADVRPEGRADRR
jgi:hypothetical protein